MINSFLKKKLASSRGAPQENDAKFRFAMHPQGIGQFHDNCKIAKCRLLPHWSQSRYSGRRVPMWQQSGTLLFGSCHGMARFLVDGSQI